MEKKYKFWIKSSRGTNKSEIVTIKNNGEIIEDEIKDELEQWCSQFGAWHVSENYVRYGYDEVTDSFGTFQKESGIPTDWNYKVSIICKQDEYCMTEKEVWDVIGKAPFGATYQVYGNKEKNIDVRQFMTL